MRDEQVLDLAEQLVRHDRSGDAVALLEERLERGFRPLLAEALWAADLDLDGAAAAERLATRLAAAEHPAEAAFGERLLARGALLRGDLAAAESHFWKAQDPERLDPELAVELLTVIGLQGGDAVLAAAAGRLCADGGGPYAEDPRCAANLLTGMRRGDLAATAIPGLTGEETAEELTRIASLARTAGRSDLQEQATRRLLEVDPLNDSGWSALGSLLEEQGRVDELVALLARSRDVYPEPPVTLARSAGRALTASDPTRAVEVLLEARDALPAKADWSRSWIDHELRGAYRRLAETRGLAIRTGIVVSPSLHKVSGPPLTGASAAELRQAADTLYDGTGGHYDPEAAIALLLRAAELGDPLSAFRLALLADGVDAETWPGVATPRRLYLDAKPAVEWLAAGGDAFARYLLGTAALTGLGGDDDPAAARRWLEAAAEQGSPMAWHNLGWMAANGIALDHPDPEAALAAYRKGIAAGVTRSARAFAELALTSEATGAVCREGLAALERAVEAGDAAAAAQLGSLRLYGRGSCVPRDAAAAVRWLEPAAGVAAPGATYDLAVALLLRDGRASGGRATELLERAAGAPNVLAIELLAFLEATGAVVPRDPVAAERWLAEAARLGSDGLPNLRREARNVEPMQPLIDSGIIALRSVGADGDMAASGFLAWLAGLGLVEGAGPEQTVALARRAAEAGDARAMRVLAGAYLRGDGVPKDTAEANRWQRRGAQAGDSFCMMFLAQDLLSGERLGRDPAAALAWLQRAAETGNWWAVGQLSDLFATGAPGIERDLDAAAAWKRRLAALGDAESAGWLSFHGYSP